MFIDFPLLSSILIICLLGSLLIYLFPAKERGTKWFAVVLSLLPLALSTIVLLGIVAPDSVELPSVAAGGQEFLAYEKSEWIPQAGISFEFGVDQLEVRRLSAQRRQFAIGVNFVSLKGDCCHDPSPRLCLLKGQSECVLCG